MQPVHGLVDDLDAAVPGQVGGAHELRDLGRDLVEREAVVDRRDVVDELLRVEVDCDRDALRFVVRQRDGFCHTGSRSCFGEAAGLGALATRLAERVETAPDGSYTQRLLSDPDLLAAKLAEEAEELIAAETAVDVAHEAADVLYFTLVAMARAGVSLEDVEAVLDRRALRLTRRSGDAKVTA